MPSSDKISNILGTEIPQWVINQLTTRSNQNSNNVRDNDNLLYLANKSAWVRLVSSVNITSADQNYFKSVITHLYFFKALFIVKKKGNKKDGEAAKRQRHKRGNAQRESFSRERGLYRGELRVCRCEF
jgi:hypothetical protein